MDIKLWKKRKKELGYTFEQLHDISGIPITTIKNIFRGYTKTPRVDTVQAIEEALYIGDENDSEHDLKFSKIIVNTEEYDLLVAYRDLGEKKGPAFQMLVREHLDRLSSL